MQLTKHHGLGNDFLVLLDLDDRRTVGSAEARAVCDRTRGVGADGFLRATRGSGADLTMELHNADGGRAEMSGNGISCLVQAALLAGAVAGPRVTVDTDAGPRTVEVVGGEKNHHHLRADLGPIGPGADDERWVVAGVRRARRLDVGNPHLVLLVDRHDAVDLEALGAKANAEIEGGINVETVVVADASVEMRVYERGVGITDACGTGACATAAAVRQWDLTDGRTEVRQPGGTATVELGDTTHYTVTVEAIAHVEWPWGES